ncbi:hypothetical protein SIK45_06000 [Clostridioides difficile]|nr:hypothetical protein [Clostridioides difficile]MDX5678793.1 hypothetical protein [Clostridioides difficile]
MKKKYIEKTDETINTCFDNILNGVKMCRIIMKKENKNEKRK